MVESRSDCRSQQDQHDPTTVKTMLSSTRETRVSDYAQQVVTNDAQQTTNSAQVESHFRETGRGLAPGSRRINRVHTQHCLPVLAICCRAVRQPNDPTQYIHTSLFYGCTEVYCGWRAKDAEPCTPKSRDPPGASRCLFWGQD